MIVYHGSNQAITAIDLSMGSLYKDFGCGYYLTPNRETAVRMAEKKTRLFGGTATLNIYMIDEKILSKLTVKRFPEKATEEWFDFIFKNRDRKYQHPVHHFDVVIGPIADDGVALQLDSVRNGLSTPAQAAVLLQDKYLDQQYCFCTIDSLKALILKETQQL